MEHIDHVASRVSVSTLVGFVGGAAVSTWKGLPRRATTFKVAMSCALVSTSLFGSERIAHTVLQPYMDNKLQLTLSSYAFSGVAGGALNGYLYQKRPLRGMFFFVPVMLGFAMAELQWEKNRQRRIQEIAQSNEGQQSGSSARGENK